MILVRRIDPSYLKLRISNSSFRRCGDTSLKEGGCDVTTSNQNRIVKLRVLDCTQVECTHTHACVGTQKLGTRNLYSA